MVYETFVEEMLKRFPALRTECYGYMDETEPLPYIALGCVLIPCLEACLQAGDVAEIAKICDFLELTASESRSDSRFDDLIGVEIGEWLPMARARDLLLSNLGPNTRRACRYHLDRLPDSPL